MSNIRKKAELEFKILESEVQDSIVMPFKNEIMALLEKFSNNGESGGSAPFTTSAILDVIKKLLSQEPLSSLKCTDLEWNDISNDYGNQGALFQNKRLTSVFKDGEDSKPYYLNAIVFKGENDITFTSNLVKLKDGSKITSSQYLRLPFTPKTFYVDVIETLDYNGEGWYNSVVKDETQLEEVFNYYEKK